MPQSFRKNQSFQFFTILLTVCETFNKLDGSEPPTYLLGYAVTF